jgi:hypothetical protein
LGARSGWWRWAPFALPLVAIVELCCHFYVTGRGPRMDDYAALAAPVAALRQDGDLVVVAPAWADPLARSALGEGAMPLAAVARPDEEPFRHAVEIGVHGARAPELAGWRELAVREVGAFTLRRLENPTAAPPVTDFVAAFGPGLADVAVTRGELASPCMWNPRSLVLAGGLGGHPTWPKERFDCGGPPWLFAGVTVIADEGYRPRRCIWAHPPERGELAVRFEGVALGERIVGHGGLDWMAERARAGAPIELTLRVDGELIGSFIHADGDGWARFEWPLGAHARAAAAEVVFGVSAPEAVNRDFCFEARSP